MNEMKVDFVLNLIYRRSFKTIFYEFVKEALEEIRIHRMKEFMSILYILIKMPRSDFLFNKDYPLFLNNC